MLVALKIQNQKYDEYVQELNNKYTKACQDGDIEQLHVLRVELAKSEIMGKENKSSHEKSKGVLEGHNYCIEHYLSIQLSENQHGQIGRFVKEILPDGISPLRKRQVFNVLMNSVIMDINLNVL